MNAKLKDDISYFKKNFLNKKYQFIKTLDETDLEEVYPNLSRIKDQIRLEYPDLEDLDIDFIVLPSDKVIGEYMIYMTYNAKYSFTF